MLWQVNYHFNQTLWQVIIHTLFQTLRHNQHKLNIGTLTERTAELYIYLFRKYMQSQNATGHNIVVHMLYSTELYNGTDQLVCRM